MRALSFAYVFQVKIKITLMSECYATERQKFLTLTCLQLSGQLSYANRATGHKSTGRAVATAIREKRDGENASDVDGYCGEGVLSDGRYLSSESKRRTAKGKDLAASHFPRAEVEGDAPDLKRGLCTVGLGSTRFEKSWFAEMTENKCTGQMEQTNRSRGQNTWS